MPSGICRVRSTVLWPDPAVLIAFMPHFPNLSPNVLPLCVDARSMKPSLREWVGWD
jgi:hypothetical protein